MEGGVRNVRGYMRLARGDIDGALEDARASLAQAREIKDPQRLIPSLLAATRVYALIGRRDEALAFAKEGIALAREHVSFAGALGQMTLVIGQLGIRDAVLEILEDAPQNPWVDAAKAAARGDYLRYARDLPRVRGADARGARRGYLLVRR